MKVNETLIRRSVGAGVFLVIALAMFPLLFDAAGYRERELQGVVPQPISLNRFTLPDVQRQPAPLTPPAAPAAAVAVPPPAPEVARALEALSPSLDPVQDPPRLDEEQLPAAWALQLASFRQEENARALRTRLINAGYRVYIRHDEDVVRVFVGPELQRQRLEQLRQRLKDEEGLDGMIVRFSTY